MNVKGFIIEDDQGRELVMVCQQPYAKVGKTFVLRGWQRRRLVPLRYTEPELRRMVGGVLTTLHDLFISLPRPIENRCRFFLCGACDTCLRIDEESSIEPDQ